MDEALRTAKSKLREISCFAATIGPGSFTGLRTGLATIKAFSAALSIPVVPIPTLHAVTIAEGSSCERIIALLPAGRREVFVQELSLNEKPFTSGSLITELGAPRHLTPDSLLAELGSATENVFWVGAGARLYAAQLRLRAGQLNLDFQETVEAADVRQGSEPRGAWRVAALPRMSLAVAAAKLARQAFARGEVVRPAGLFALYVRPSDVELKERSRR